MWPCAFRVTIDAHSRTCLTWFISSRIIGEARVLTLLNVSNTPYFQIDIDGCVVEKLFTQFQIIKPGPFLQHSLTPIKLKHVHTALTGKWEDIRLRSAY
jgi:hypothetical protein